MARLITVIIILTGIVSFGVCGMSYTNDMEKRITAYVENAFTACENEDQAALKKESNAMSSFVKKRHSVLSLFVRHDEIEKIETHLTTLLGYCELNAFDSARICLLEIRFMAEHIHARELLTADNIF